MASCVGFFSCCLPAHYLAKNEFKIGKAFLDNGEDIKFWGEQHSRSYENAANAAWSQAIVHFKKGCAYEEQDPRDRRNLTIMISFLNHPSCPNTLRPFLAKETILSEDEYRRYYTAYSSCRRENSYEYKDSKERLAEQSMRRQKESDQWIGTETEKIRNKEERVRAREERLKSEKKDGQATEHTSLLHPTNK